MIVNNIIGILISKLFSRNSNAGKISKPQQEISKEHQLKAFMVGGMYFFRNYQEGVATLENIVAKNLTQYDSIITFYYNTFNLRTKPAEESICKTTLSDWWGINSKEELVDNLKKLGIPNNRRKKTHKAWNYARLVNNTCVGYGAGYLSAEEAKKFVIDNFATVQSEYETWIGFLNDYNLGRWEWDSTSTNAAEYDKIVADMTLNPAGIYTLLPLNNK